MSTTLRKKRKIVSTMLIFCDNDRTCIYNQYLKYLQALIDRLEAVICKSFVSEAYVSFPISNFRWKRLYE